MTRNAVDDIIFVRWMGVECSVRNKLVSGLPAAFQRARLVGRIAAMLYDTETRR